MRLLIVGMAAAFAVAGCATPYVATPYDRASAQVTEISVVDDSVPARLIAPEIASVGSNFGLVGAIANAGIQASREDAMMDALNGIGFDAELAFEQAVAAQLQEAGYSIEVLSDGERDDRDFLEEYAGGAAGVDGYLDVVVLYYGYIASGAFQPWRPTLEVQVRLVSPDGETLMENHIAYNTMYPRDGYIILTPNPTYAFQNRDAMLADPAVLADGIEDAMAQTAATIANLLR